MTNTQREALHRHFQQKGQAHAIEGNKPVLVTGPEHLWYVAVGTVDVFAVELRSGQGKGGDKRRYLFSLEPGAVLFGFAGLASDQPICLLLSSIEAQVYAVHRDTLPLPEAHPSPFWSQLSSALEDWVENCSMALSMRHTPSALSTLEQQDGTEQALEPDSYWKPPNTVWVNLKSGSAQWMGEHTLAGSEDAGIYFPLAPTAWLWTAEGCRVEVVDTTRWLQLDQGWEGLLAFYRLAAGHLAAMMEKERQVERERLLGRAQHDQTLMDLALKQLLAVTAKTEGDVPPQGTADPLFLACRLVGEKMGIGMKPAPPRKESGSRDPVEDIAQASGARTRKVMLKDQWWRHDNGPLLAYLEETGEPIALLPASPTSYRWHHPVTGEEGVVDKEKADQFRPLAYMFYRPLPSRAIGIWDILRYGAERSVFRDTMVILLTGAMGGILGLFIPIATGMLYDHVIPEGYRGPLWQMGLILLAIALSASLLQITGSIATLRLEGRMSSALQAAVWDRLLRLPVGFFRQYTAGDLASRANSINAIRQMLSGAALRTMLAGIFSIFQFLLLFRYDAQLALIAGGLVIIAFAVTAAFTLLEVRYQRELLEVQGRIAGIMLQLFNGISKFRMAAAEKRAFFLWSRPFAQQKRIAFKARNIEICNAVFQSLFPILVSMVLFYIVAMHRFSITAGAFLAFTAAFGSFLSAMLNMGSALLSLVGMVPLYERAKPILQALPEMHEGLEDPGEISGAIEVRGVNFRYRPDQPYILRNISLSIKPGEFVAFVGASGSGKTSLMRIMLGFEKPESGSVYFDGRDLRTLDLNLLRKQFGVVLQNSRVMAGDIYTNIAGTSSLTMEEAWEAAAMAGLDEDIRNMPMGMHTVLSEGGSTLSGGQRQRLLIARAIASRPQIIFFDEATSALDNRTQAIVSESLKRLQATRIVIAHRLSTIINADRIYVFDKGAIVQEGTYEELISVPGPFAEQARRQLA